MKLIANLAPIDKQAIEILGIPGILLMEAAGNAIAKSTIEVLETLTHDTVVILCGPGNNGGDGFCCARKLVALGKSEGITVLHTITKESYHGDAKTSLELLAHYPVDVIEVTDVHAVEKLILDAAVVVDALFGSGLSRPTEGIEAELIDVVNSEAKHPEQVVIAVDFPSGIEGHRGQMLGHAIKADLTITLATPKPGLFLPPGKHHAGLIRCVDIGIPQHLIDAYESPYWLITPKIVNQFLPIHQPDSHKYSVGSTMILAGSSQMPGAAELCANAAMVSGAGMVTLAATPDVFDHIRLSPEIIRASLATGTNGQLGIKALETIQEALQAKKCRSIAIGPGMGESQEIQELLKQLLPYCHQQNITVILDADGLNNLAALKQQGVDITALLSENTVLTPHVGEFSRLSGENSADIIQDLCGLSMQACHKLGCTVVLKSSACVVATSETQCWINPTGNVGMATAGSGDVLTGLLGALCAQGLSASSAALCTVFLHGLAGDLSAHELGAHAMRASDMISKISKAFCQVQDGEPEIC